MAATLNELATMLDKIGIHYDNDGEGIRFESNGKDHIYLFVYLQEEGELLDITVKLDDPNGSSLAIPFDHQYIKELMAYLLHQSYQYKLGFWAYDPNDGDIQFKITHSIESNDLSEDQFQRLVTVARVTADHGAIAIRHILETGEVPEEEDDDEQIPDLSEVVDIDALKKELSLKAAALIQEGKIDEAKELLAMLAQLDESSDAEEKSAIDGI